MAQINKIFNGSIKIPTVVFFIATILVIMYFLPREGKYKYTYTENRPWQYGLLTAPFNFYIHKSAEQIQQEKDSVLRSYQPYYENKQSVAKDVVSQFEQNDRVKSVPAEYISYVSRKLSEIYKGGIISVEDYDKVQNLNKKQLQLRNENEIIFSTRHLASFYTPRQAYDKILGDAPKSLDPDILKALDFKLDVSILFDEKKSNDLKKQMQDQVALYQGEIQSGEKIIDRGEIVDARTKNILDSYSSEVVSKVGTKSKPGWLIFGELVMITLFIMSLMVYLRFYRLHEYNNRKNVIFMLIMVVIFPVITGLMADTKMF
ncbi:MAG: hydrolase, partial [Dysgonomonas sp.]